MRSGWAIIVYTAIGASVISQIFYIRGNELIGANRAGLFINLVPIFGTLLSVLIVGETFQLYQALALVLVLGGIGLAEYSGRKMADLPQPGSLNTKKARIGTAPFDLSSQGRAITSRSRRTAAAWPSRSTCAP